MEHKTWKKNYYKCMSNKEQTQAIAKGRKSVDKKITLYCCTEGIDNGSKKKRTPNRKTIAATRPKQRPRCSVVIKKHTKKKENGKVGKMYISYNLCLVYPQGL